MVKHANGASREYVEIDISRSNENNGIYHDKRMNEITIKEEMGSVNSPGLNGYKTYVHKIHKQGAYIGRVLYKFNDQIGLGNGLIDEQYITAIVYYWRHDDENAMPLLIGMATDDDSYEYYSRTSYITSNYAWHKDHDGKDGGKNVTAKLGEISAMLRNLVLININSTLPYFANGDPINAPAVNKDVQISVTIESIYCNFKRHIHRLSSGDPMTIMGTKVAGKGMALKDLSIFEEYLSASIYFWDGDNGHKYPLLLELVSSGYKRGGSIFLKMVKEEWLRDESINENPLHVLKRLNCSSNGAHCIELTKEESYKCTSCDIPIRVMPGDQQKEDFAIFKQSIKNGSTMTRTGHRNGQNGHSGHSSSLHAHPFSVGTFSCDQYLQSGIESARNVSEVEVFFYPKHGGDPLLVHYCFGDQDHWLKADSRSANRWLPLQGVHDGQDDHHNDHYRGYCPDKSSILSLLICSHSPTVAIDIREGKNMEDGKSMSYPHISKEGKEVITVLRSDLHGTYPRFIHSVKGKGSFRLSSLTYGEFSLQNTRCSGILTSVAVFYWHGDKEYEKPLLVELEFKNGTYKYMNRRDSDPNTWEFCYQSQTCRVTGSTLTGKLDRMVKRDFTTLSMVLVDTLVAVVFGLGMVCFAITEGINAATNPKKSVVQKVINLCKRKV